MIIASFGPDDPTPPSTTGLVGRPSILLSEVASAVARVEIVEPHLAAGEIRIVAVPARTPLTRVSISTRDELAARRLAAGLSLDDDRASQLPWSVWTGHPVSQDTDARALRVDLLLEGETSTQTTTLTEATNLLYLIDSAAPTEISVARVHLRPSDAELEIRTIHRRDADTLQRELADLDLPLRPVVHALTA